MKFISYWYFFNFLHCEKKCPDIDPHKESTRVMVFPLAMVLTSIIFQVLVQLEILDLILQSWPYDYGNVHSKNFIAPTSILFIACYIFARKLVCSEHLRRNFLNKNNTQIQYDEEKLRIHFRLTETLIFYFVFIALFIGFGLFKTLLIALLPLAYLEYWIRNNQIKNTSKAC